MGLLDLILVGSNCVSTCLDSADCEVGVVFFVTACAALFVGVQVMFETREQELRQGIKLKC